MTTLSAGHSLHPLLITALLGDADFAWADGLRRAHYPAARNQVPAHIMLIHHLPPARESEVRRLLGDLARSAPPRAVIHRVLRFQRGVAFGIDSQELENLRDTIADHFLRDLIPVDQAADRLHVTIQDKASTEEAKALHSAVSAEFYPRPITIAGLGLWSYRDGPWVMLARYAFRGRKGARGA